MGYTIAEIPITSQFILLDIQKKAFELGISNKLSQRQDRDSPHVEDHNKIQIRVGCEQSR